MDINLSLVSATSTFGPGDATSLITGAVSDIGTTLVQAMPVVLGLISALIGFFFVFRWVKRHVGSGKR